MRTVQWLFSKLMPAETDTSLDAAPALNVGEVFPYTVPSNFWLALTDATIQSKAASNHRSSYFVVENVFSLPSHVGVYSFRVPLVLSPGFVVRGRIINNAGIEQFINVSLHGVLLRKSGPDYRDALDRYMR